MADPVLPGVIRVQAVMQGHSNLPEDRYVTTWAFTSDVASSDAGKAAAIAKVRNFYTVAATNGATLANFISGQAVNPTTSVLKAYDLGQPPNQRVPYVEPFTGLTASAAAGLPSEIAVCVSYYAGFNQPGLRGRIYFGPLITSAVVNAAATPPRVTSQLLQALVDKADQMASVTAFPRWVIISGGSPQGSKQARIITNGWVDNAFDIQRRRGEKANVRTTWVA